jgi:hypothetical protein
MKSTQKLGNRILVLAAAIVFAISALVVPWGKITVKVDGPRQQVGTSSVRGNSPSAAVSAGMNDMTVTVTAREGSINLGPVRLPYWLAIMAVIFGLVVTITNATALSDVSRVIVLGLFWCGIAIGGWAILLLQLTGTLDLGVLLFLSAATAGLLQQPGRTEGAESIEREKEESVDQAP